MSSLVSLSETFLNISSSDRARDSVPEQYRAHFDELRSGILAFCKEFEIPPSALSNKETFGVALASRKPPIPFEKMENVSHLFRGLEYLLTHHELWEDPEELQEAKREAEEFYELSKQYDAQVELLKQTGILHPRRERMTEKAQRLSSFLQSLLPFGKKKRPEVKETQEPLCITGIDGKEYPLPTLEQIALRLRERKELLKTKREQGFDRLLLVPFGMSLNTLIDTLRQFLKDYKKVHSEFGRFNPSIHDSSDKPDWDPVDTTWERSYMGNPSYMYFPKRFTYGVGQGKSKFQILREQTKDSLFTPGWRVLLLQSPFDEAPGFRHIPREGKGRVMGEKILRRDLVSNKLPEFYLSILQKAQEDPSSPYHGESGMTPEDWILAFMNHLKETGKPLDNDENEEESLSYLVGAYHPSITRKFIPYVSWSNQRVYLQTIEFASSAENVGTRSVVAI